MYENIDLPISKHSWAPPDLKMIANTLIWITSFNFIAFLHKTEADAHGCLF